MSDPATPKLGHWFAQGFRAAFLMRPRLGDGSPAAWQLMAMLALVDGRPQFLTLKEMMRKFLDHRVQVIRRSIGPRRCPRRKSARRDPCSRQIASAPRSRTSASTR